MSLASEQAVELILMGGWFVLGFIVAIAYLAFEMATNYAFLRWLFNVFEFLRPDNNRMQYIRFGELAAVSHANMKWSIAAINLNLWPVLLIVNTLKKNRSGFILSVAVFMPTLILTFGSTHTTSKISIFLASMAFLCCRRWITSARRFIMMLWVATIVTSVPLSMIAFHVNLHKNSWVPQTGQQRLAMWGYLANKVADAPILGAGVRTTYAHDQQQNEEVVVHEIAQSGVLDVPLSHPHNIYIQVWFELGALGAGLFLVSGLFVLRSIGRLAIHSQPFALATWVNAMTVAGSSWEMWQTWFVAIFGLSVIAMAMAATIAQKAPPYNSSGDLFRRIYLPNLS